MSEALFTPIDDTFLPSPLAGSPWSDGVLHGGAPAGLLAYCFQRHAGAALQPARLSIDLLRPVPRSPLTVNVSPLRQGKRIELWQAQILAGDTLVAVASALFVALSPVVLPESAPRHPFEIALPDALDEISFRDVLFNKSGNMPPGLHTTVRLRPASSLTESGEGTAWIHLPVPIVAGAPNTPFMLAALTSDFGNGVGQLSVADGVGTINADVMLQLSRMPQGEWIALQSTALLDDGGIGQVMSHLYDQSGRVGSVTQTIMPMKEFGR